MAQDAIDAAVQSGHLAHAKQCVSCNLRLAGARGWHPGLYAELSQTAADYGLRAVDLRVAQHLAHAYGDRAVEVLKLARSERTSSLLVPGQPILQAEVVFCARAEFCATAVDFIARRSRLAFLDVSAARAALPSVIRLLGDEHRWSKDRRRSELAASEAFLATFSV
jgi:glycerol-3-phosphate dehydrogenase